MEVIKPSTAGVSDHHQFNFNSASNSPYVTAPSSPQRFGNYIFTTAPATPTRATTFHNDSDHDTSSTIPFNWEEKPGTPKSISSQCDDTDQDDDFAFDFSSHLDPPPLSAADDLFYGGKIKPLKPPPRLSNFEIRVRSDINSPKSPRQRIKKSLSPRKKVKEFDPFAAAMEETRRPQKIQPTNWYKKLKLKNLLLFRSASEGHREKYEKLKKSNDEDSKNWSSRSADGPVKNRRVSAHEWHYTMNRTAAEEMRRKTYLPYKQGLFGCLGFRVAGVNEISNRGIGITSTYL